MLDKDRQPCGESQVSGACEFEELQSRCGTLVCDPTVASCMTEEMRREEITGLFVDTSYVNM